MPCPRGYMARDHDRGGRLSGLLDEFGSEDEEDRGRRRAQLGLREAAGGVGEAAAGEGDDDDDDDAQGEVCMFFPPIGTKREARARPYVVAVFGGLTVARPVDTHFPEEGRWGNRGVYC